VEEEKKSQVSFLREIE